MATTFNGITLAGYTTNVRPGEHVSALTESVVAGVVGKTVLADVPHGREIRVEHKLTGFASAAALKTYLDVSLKNGILKQRGTLAVAGYETYADLICHTIDPNPTEVGTLPDTSVPGATTYHRTIRILFTQLS
jgi:hypothetical protein